MIARYAIPFFMTMGFVVFPLVSYFLCRWLLPRRYGRKTGLFCAMIIIMVVAYGMTYGFKQLEVRHIEFASSDLPEAFDGYRIVHFSDAHVGTYVGKREPLLQRAVDSINAQQADMVVFTGDMQNIYPDELAPHVACLRQLKAKDGVYAVLGNHDYAVYQDCDEQEKQKHCLQTIEAERQMGFDLLLNEHRIIRRDSDSIVIAGMENWGLVKRMPRRGDVRKTLAGLANSQQPIANSPFVIMLEHDPSAWREKILPECHAQLTLSGHTHGGQFAILGWSPVALSYSEWAGTTYEGDRAIHVSTGLGGLIPFRFGQPGEIVVITLKKK